MKRVYINQHINTMAQQYAMLLSRQAPNQLESLINGLKRKTVKKYPSLPSAIAYVNQIKDDFESLLTLPYSEWSTYKLKYEKTLSSDYSILKTSYTINKKNRPLYMHIVDALSYATARQILGQIHTDMGLRTCAYCNASPTISGRGQIFYEMDHYWPKSKYPFLGVCFFNLIPACSSCNGRKSSTSKDIFFYLYTENVNEAHSPFVFEPQLINIRQPQNWGCYEIKLKNSQYATSDEAAIHNKHFKIEDRYLPYRYVVTNLYNACTHYPKCVIDDWKNVLGVEVNDNEMCQHLFLFPWDEERTHEEMLLKLKIDTLEQIKHAGLLPF